MDKTILKNLPERTIKARQNGITMVMDKGLSFRQAEDMLSIAEEHIDIVKLGFGTALVSKNILDKIRLYKRHGIRVYLGGTLFEAFLIRKQIDDYVRLLEKWELDCVEVSDGSINISHTEKLKLIEKFSKGFTVLSEVGSKDSSALVDAKIWATMMKDEISAGAWKVIAEARESGTVGLYESDGKAKTELINEITSRVSDEKILWEAPQKSQQIFFIQQKGANVNLGNISPSEIIPLETLRLGLRGDTFDLFFTTGQES